MSHVHSTAARQQLGGGLSLVLLLLLLLTGQAQAAGCTDSYDGNGNSNDNLTSHPLLASVPTQINRSLCGFYNADYVEFPTQPGTSYRIQVLDHEDPVGYGVYLELWESPGGGVYTHLATTTAGTVLLDTPATVTANLIVRIASTRSDVGSYGGGDYRLAITVNGSPAATATPTVTPTHTATALPPPTVTATATATTQPTTTAQATPPTSQPTPATTATPIPSQTRQLCLPLIMR